MPETDGQWIENVRELVVHRDWDGAEDNPTSVDLSDYFSDDGHKYLIELRLSVNSNVANSVCQVRLFSTVDNSIVINAETALSTVTHSFRYLVIGTDRLVKYQPWYGKGRVTLLMIKAKRLAN